MALGAFVERIIAPTTFLVAVGFFFGRRFTFARASYFGIDASLLDLSMQDYALRSVDALFVPVTWLILLALLGLLLHRAILHSSDVRPKSRFLLLVGPLFAIAGSALLVAGLYAMVRDLPGNPHYLIPPLLPALGMAFLSYGTYLRVQLEPERRSQAIAPHHSRMYVLLIGGFMVLSLFWAASEYASALGSERARDLAENLSRQPSVLVFSEQRLALSGPGISERRLNEQDSRYLYAYEGYKFLLRTEERFFLVPAEWSRAEVPALMLVEDGTIRFEFIPGDSPRGER